MSVPGTTTATVLPPNVAAKVKPGHAAFEDDPPLSSVRRWTCSACGAAVLDSGAVIYGTATELPCPAESVMDHDAKFCVLCLSGEHKPLVPATERDSHHADSAGGTSKTPTE